MANPTKAHADQIETLIDSIGLAETLNLIAAVCAAKADHIRASYSDETLAAWWDAAGARASKSADLADRNAL